MFERYTDRARRVVVLAQEEARILDHAYIGTEHILLGLIHESEGVAARLLVEHGFTLENVRAAVVEILGEGSGKPGNHIPFTIRARRCLELSLREALQLGASHIGTEHILLGIVREAEQADEVGVAARVLRDRLKDVPWSIRTKLTLMAAEAETTNQAQDRLIFSLRVSPAARVILTPSGQVLSLYGFLKNYANWMATRHLYNVGDVGVKESVTIEVDSEVARRIRAIPARVRNTGWLSLREMSEMALNNPD